MSDLYIYILGIYRKWQELSRNAKDWSMLTSFLHESAIKPDLLRAVPEIILGEVQTLFCPVGGGCFVDNVSEGWGVEG